MATVIPPPNKRQKLDQQERARQQQEPKIIPSGSVRIHFIDRSTQESIGNVFSVSLEQATVSNLKNIINSFEKSDDQLNYQLFFRPKQNDSKKNIPGEIVLSDGTNIYESLIEPGFANTEEEVVLELAPQAIFKVRSVSRCSSSITGHGEPILTSQFSPSSSLRFVTGSGDHTARIWDCETGTPLYTLKGHTSWVLVVAFSPDDTMIATGSHDNTCRIWEAKSGKPLGGALQGHTKFVRSLSWEPFHLEKFGQPRLASASKDASVRIWNVSNRKTDFILNGHKSSISCVRWGGTGFLYTASQDRTIKIWDSNDGRLIHTLSSHSHWVNHLALSTDFVLRTSFFDHTNDVPKTFDLKVEKAKNRFESSAKIGNKLIEKLVSASDDNVLYLWDPLGENPTKPLTRMNGHQKAINHVTFSPNGLYIASSSFDNSIKLWSGQDGKFLMTFRGHVGPVYQSCFSPDSRLLVSSSKDTTLKCWDIKSGKLQNDLPGHKDEVYTVDWSSDGKKVGSGGKDKVVRLWRH